MHESRSGKPAGVNEERHRMKKNTPRDPEPAAGDAPGFCPAETDLFAFVEDPGLLNRKKKKIIDGHLRQCPLCSEEVSLLRAKLDEAEADTAPALLESSIDRLIADFSSAPEKIVPDDRLRDILARYPRPSTRRFDRKRAGAWLKKVGEKAGGIGGGIGDAIAGIFAPAPAGVFELSPAAVRSGAKTARLKEDELSDLLQSAGRAMDAGEYREAGEFYSEICRLVRGQPLEFDARLHAGIAFLRCGEIDLAASNLGDSIHEAAGPENYWLLARALLEKGEFEGAFKSLQIVEGMSGELGDRAARLLDEMQGPKQ